jgi:hypothetical protein
MANISYKANIGFKWGHETLVYNALDYVISHSKAVTASINPPL